MIRPPGALLAEKLRRAQKEVMLNGRSLIDDDRYSGSITEWHGGWGWIEPTSQVAHEEFQKNSGRIYLHKNDAHANVKLAVGVKLDFQIYCAARGLGAVDCFVFKTAEQKTAEEAAAAAAVAAEWSESWEGGEDGGTEQDETEPAATEAEPAEAAAAEEEVPLPPGWKKVWSDEHNEYYFWNKKTKETSWEQPVAAAEEPAEENADDEPPLPAGWSKEYDEGSEQYYYWDKLNKVASWDRPTKAAPGAVPEKLLPIKKDIVAKPSAKVAARALTATKASSGDDSESALPPGWKQMWSDEHDCYYYWNKATKTPVWERPTMPDGGEAEQEEPPSKKAKLTKIVPAAATDAENNEGNEPPLPPGWKQVWSEEHTCYYYWNKASKTPVWERPTASAPERGEVQEQQPKKRAAPKVARAAPKVAAKSLAPADENEPPLPPGWKQVWSEEHSCYYYWNKSSKTPVWERPGSENAATEADDEESTTVARPAVQMSGQTPITPTFGAVQSQLDQGQWDPAWGSTEEEQYEEEETWTQPSDPRASVVNQILSGNLPQMPKNFGGLGKGAHVTGYQEWAANNWNTGRRNRKFLQSWQL